ncbi:protrudin-like [Anguilla anguilla]|uniref:protrudin-like n=1 Tax=Anguilla anguilla TaxID=7936 RepID=UPI0015ABDEDC|nr:protrudin-like [Anguilla anguilla]
MPQSRVNSAPCLYTAHTSEEGSEMPENSEGLTFDLFNTVTTLRNLMAFLEPLNISFRLVKNLLGWKICSLLCGVLLNILFLTLSEEAWLLLGLLCVFALAILGYLKQSPRRTATSLALRRQRPSSESMEDQQALALEMKALLRELDEMLSPACLSAESAHSLLCWGSYSDSALFYGALLAVLYLLYTAPGSYTLVVTNSALFLWKGELHRVVRNMIFWRRSPEATEGHREHREKTAFPGNANISWEDLDETDDLDAEYDFKDAIEDDDDDEDYGMPLIIRRGALVGEIPNLHQKGQKRARRRRLHSSSNSGEYCSVKHNLVPQTNADECCHGNLL